jgi:uncharacterized membrane protein (UPF0127 family)
MGGLNLLLAKTGRVGYRRAMKHLLLSALFLALAAPAFAQTAKSDSVDFGAPVPLSVVSKDSTHNFSIERAVTLDQQARGMMFREAMEPDTGMLFEFDEPKIATIWMKNTSIPLDILFVRSNGKILKIEHMAQPYKLRSASSEAVVAAVLELQGGRAKELGIKPGDIVQHAFFGTASP